jgi:excisionase family DNA binding protein
MSIAREPTRDVPEAGPDRPRAEQLLSTMEKSLETVRHVFGESHRYYADSLEHYAKALDAMGATQLAWETSLRAAEVHRSIADRESAAVVPWKVGGKTESDSVQPRVLDAQGAARYLSLGLDTLYRLVRSGELPHSRVGKSIRFRPEDLDEYIAARVTREWTRVDRRGRPRQTPVEKPTPV